MPPERYAMLVGWGMATEVSDDILSGAAAENAARDAEPGDEPRIFNLLHRSDADQPGAGTRGATASADCCTGLGDDGLRDRSVGTTDAAMGRSSSGTE